MPVAEGWARRGLTLLWGAEALRDLALPPEVRPLRTLFGGRSNWPEQLQSNGGRVLIAAGLEATLDCLSPADAEQWLEQDLRDLVLAFQDAYQGARALVFWLPSGRERIKYDAPNDAWLWATPGDTPLPHRPVVVLARHQPAGSRCLATGGVCRHAVLQHEQLRWTVC